MIILKLFSILFLTLVIWVIMQVAISGYKLLSFFKQGTKGRTQPQSAQNTMVKCATCNLYILDTDAISRNGTYYCSPEHAKGH